MIRLRRLPPRFLLRRIYEVEFTPDEEGTPSWHRVTSTPVTLIDPYLGVGDAWSVVRAADDVWAGGEGEWVSFPPLSPDPGGSARGLRRR